MSMILPFIDNEFPIRHRLEVNATSEANSPSGAADIAKVVNEVTKDNINEGSVDPPAHPRAAQAVDRDEIECIMSKASRSPYDVHQSNYERETKLNSDRTTVVVDRMTDGLTS